MIEPIGLLLLSYLCGSIPTSWVVGRVFAGVDLRDVGSGNLGATNTYRVLGMKGALPVGLVDVTKGWLPTWLFPAVDGVDAWTMALAYGGAAIFGHIYSVWVRFRGGKGVATSAGVFIALAPAAMGVALVVWIAFMFAWKIVSLASVAAAVSLPLAIVWLDGAADPRLLGFTVALAAFVVWTHRANIGRLLRGEERRIGDTRRARSTAGSTSDPEPRSGERSP